MKEEPEEVDYLAQAKEQATQSFATLVREAFGLEHGCVRDYEIGKLTALSPGRIAQIFKKPGTLEASTIKKLISPLQSAAHRKSIQRAWQKLYFADLIEGEGDTLLADTPDPYTTNRIDKLIRQHRVDRALKVTREALQKVSDPGLREGLFDREFFLELWLDRTGAAMKTANSVYAWGEGDKNLQRMANALAMRARVLRHLEGIALKTVEKVHAEALSIIDSIPRPLGPTRATREAFKTEHIALVLKYTDRYGGAEEYLRESLRIAELEVDSNSAPVTKRNTFQMQARIHLALGNPFLAEELLDRSFESGQIDAVNTEGVSSLIKAKILASRGAVDEAIDYYEKVVALCEERRHLYHLRLAEHDLAILRSCKFPPSRPV